MITQTPDLHLTMEKNEKHENSVKLYGECGLNGICYETLGECYFDQELHERPSRHCSKHVEDMTDAIAPSQLAVGA